MKVLLLVFAAAAVLAGADSAQSSAPGTKSIRVAPRHATIDVATGELTRDTDDKASDLVIVWANTDWSGRGATPSSVAPEEWLDWGSLTTTSGSDIVGSFQFGYWTTALGTTTGGPGLSLCTNFYEGATGWCAESGLGLQPDVQYCWSGLPGSNTSGVPAAWIITVNLTGGFEFRQPLGPFGYAMSLSDTIAGPLLMYAGSSGGGFDTNGQENAFDVYVPDLATGTCGSVSFGGGPPTNYASFWLSLSTADGNTGTPASCTWYCGTGVNTDGFVVSAPPMLGGTFVGSVAGGGGQVGAFLAAYSAPLTLTTQWGELLVDITDPGGELLGLPIALGNPAVLSLPVPINLQLCGFPFYVQAVSFGGAFTLHCAQSCTIGF